MNRKELEVLAAELFGADAEHPFANDQSTTVFRHQNNRKWFALVMTIPGRKLGLHDQGMIDVVNLKCAPEIMDSLWQEKGIYPAYHMSKTHWITVALDGTVDADTIQWLLGISFDLTSLKKRAPKPQKGEKIHETTDV